MDYQASNIHFILSLILKATSEIKEEYQPESSSSESVQYSLIDLALSIDLLNC